MTGMTRAALKHDGATFVIALGRDNAFFELPHINVGVKRGIGDTMMHFWS
jgi:hypothetical protein